MSDATIVIIVSAVQTIFLAILAALVKIWSDRQTQTDKDVADTKDRIKELEKESTQRGTTEEKEQDKK